MIDIGDADMDGLLRFDGLIVGAPTWNTGSDEMRSMTDWDDKLDSIRELSLKGKPVAVFGLGDSCGYGDYFCDAIEELHDAFESAGGKMIGYVSPEGYDFTDSKSVRDGRFLGLPLDATNEDDLTEDRVKAWTKQLASEGGSRQIVDTAGAVGDVAHNDGLAARESLQDVRDRARVQQQPLGHLDRHALGGHLFDAPDGLEDLEIVVGGERAERGN